MHCDAKEICPAGSWKPLEECKGLYKRNNETEVTQVAYHSVAYFKQRMLVYVYELWVVFYYLEKGGLKFSRLS